MYSTYSKLYQYCTGSSPAIVDCTKFVPDRLSSYQLPAEVLLFQSSDDVAARAWNRLRLGAEESYRDVNLAPPRLDTHSMPPSSSVSASLPLPFPLKESFNPGAFHGNNECMSCTMCPKNSGQLYSIYQGINQNMNSR